MPALAAVRPAKPTAAIKPALRALLFAKPSLSESTESLTESRRRSCWLFLSNSRIWVAFTIGFPIT